MQTVCWGLVGAGDIAEKRVAPALRDLPDCRLAGVCRKQSDRVKEFAERFGAEASYLHFEDLLNDDAIDAVYMATPVHLHAPMTIAAARAGKHVLCEKPMALNVAQCDEMIAAAAENHIKLGFAYYRHFYPMVVRIRELLNQGVVGQPILAQANAFEFFNPAPGQRRAWLLEKRQSGGGPMFDFGCHRIEVFHHLFGELQETTGLLDTLAFAREVEDTATAVFRCATGTIAVLSVTHAAVCPRDTLDIFGTEGSLHVPRLNGHRLEVLSGGRSWTEEHPTHPNVHQPMIERFSRSIIEDTPPEVGADIARAVNVALAALGST